MIGFMTVFVGIAWALQILGFSEHTSAMSQLAWVIAAASISGAGVGLVVTAGGLPEEALQGAEA